MEGAAGRVGRRAGWGVAVAGRMGGGGPGGAGSGWVGQGEVHTFIQPKSVFVWRSKVWAPKPGRIGNFEKSCSALEKVVITWRKVGKCWRKKIQCWYIECELTRFPPLICLIFPLKKILLIGPYDITIDSG